MTGWMTRGIATKLSAAMICLMFAGFAATAHAQWGWTDAAGKKQFSDQPPPSDVPDKNVFKRPPGSALLTGGPVYGTQAVPAKGSAQAAAAALAASAATNGVSPSSGGASAPKESASKPKTPEEQFKERQDAKAKADAEAKLKAELVAKNKADCDRGRGYLKSLEEGSRVGKTDAQGNRVLLDEGQRAAEATRIRSEISSNCK